MGRGLFNFILAACTPKLWLSILRSYTQELRFGTLDQQLPAPMGCSNRYCVNRHITGIKAAASRDQHIIINPTEEAINARLHPEDDRSTVVQFYVVPNGLLWTLSAPCLPCLKASSRRHPIFLPPGRACLSCSREEKQYGCGEERDIQKK